jgi:hypothetical protein
MKPKQPLLPETICASPPDAPKQPALLDVPAAEFVAKLEADGEYTGERLREQRPEVYRRVIALLSQGHGTQFIQDMTGVSRNTVKAVRRVEGDTIDLLKERVAEGNFEFAAQADEAASTILSEIMADKARRRAMTMKDVQSLKVASSIAVQNGQLLTGKPTANVRIEEFSQPSPDLEAQIAAHLADLKSANPTHLGGEKTSQKEGGGTGSAGNTSSVVSCASPTTLADAPATAMADGESVEQPA